MSPITYELLAAPRPADIVEDACDHPTALFADELEDAGSPMINHTDNDELVWGLDDRYVVVTLDLWVLSIGMTGLRARFSSKCSVSTEAHASSVALSLVPLKSALNASLNPRIAHRRAV